jgi:hypothetical protein
LFNVTVFHRDFTDRALEIPSLCGTAIHDEETIGVMKLCQFDFSFSDEDDKQFYLAGFCRARQYASNSVEANPWLIMSLEKGTLICQACSDAMVLIFDQEFINPDLGNTDHPAM